MIDKKSLTWRGPAQPLMSSVFLIYFANNCFKNLLALVGILLPAHRFCQNPHGRELPLNLYPLLEFLAPEKSLLVVIVLYYSVSHFLCPVKKFRMSSAHITASTAGIRRVTVICKIKNVTTIALSPLFPCH